MSLADMPFEPWTPSVVDLDQECDPIFGVHADHQFHGCGRDPYEKGAA